MNTKKKRYRRNIINKKIEVINSKNKNLIGISGIVVDETKNMIIIDVKGKHKKIIKNTVILKIGEEIVNGEELIGTIDERLKY